MANHCKKILPALILVFCFVLDSKAQQKLLIRVYPTGTGKVVKGFYGGHNDSSIIIQSKQQFVTVSYLQIQNIRTKKTVGHNILVGSVTGAVVGAIAGLAAHKDPEPLPENCWFCITFETTAADDAAIGFILGSMAGAAIGTISGFAKKKENLIVAGNFGNWKTVISRMDKWPVFREENTNK